MSAEPERTCIVTKAKADPEALIRFVLSPEGEVVPDLRHKLPGRGVWVSARADVIETAVKRQAFGRAFRAEVKVPPRLAEEIDVLLAQICLQALSLAKKAGQVVAGFFKVEAAIATGRVIGLVHARDASPDGGRKLSHALMRASSEPRPEIKSFTSEQLSLALGSTNVVHAALTEGAASAAFLSHCRRLARYRCDASAAPERAAAEASGEMSADAETRSLGQC
ncbi:MAG TPA: RNA-binding protein [Alphaproteobacteria bacterium]|nr:RNA-binding protein [Alphaproteobacteria bacterium]